MKRCAWFAQLKPFLWLTIVTSAFLINQSTHTLDIVVTSEDNSGLGTLRQAIEDTNNAGIGPHTITFALNVKTISLLSPLPQTNSTVTIDGFVTGSSYCDQLSPVSDPEAFSGAIRITIDGSNIPNNGSTPIIGLVICGDDVIVRGIRIAHFSNTNDTFVAGIVTDGINTRVECCEVTDLAGNISSSEEATVIGIYEERANTIPSTIISKCFVHDLYTINHNTIEPITKTGSIFGIGFVKEVRESRIEHLKSGSIIQKNQIPTGSNPPQLATGNVFGIVDRSNNESMCIAKKRCEFIDNCQGSECIEIENCVVNCCKSGSILSTESAAVTLGSSVGIRSNNPIFTEVMVTNCTVCNISTGSVMLSNGTFSLSTAGPFGIETAIENSYFTNNIITTINRGPINISGLDSTAALTLTSGIFSSGTTEIFSTGTISAQNNYIADIHCQPIIASGICTTIEEGNELEIENPSCIGNLANPIRISRPVCSGIFATSENTIHLCNNTIVNINTGKKSATGKNALIRAGFSSGVFALTNTNSTVEIKAEHNSIRNIFGATLYAGPESRGIFGGMGSRGVALWALNNRDYTITAEKNLVEQVCEQTIRTARDVPGEYIFIKKATESQTEALKPVAQTIGISIKTNTSNIPNSSSNIIVNNNTIKTIAGAVAHGNNPGFGTMAIGIAVEAPLIGQFDRTTKQEQEACSLLTINQEKTSKINDNKISSIWGGTKNTAYGILLDATNSALQTINQETATLPLFFSIAQNTITNITGFGTPQPFEVPTREVGSCGTTEQEAISFVPFPYQPTSGIYTIFGNCSTISGNTTTNITEPNKKARGITTQASSDVTIEANKISYIDGYGIFIGGATASATFINDNGLFTQTEFETLFASERNKISSNSTGKNTKQGIKLGLIDWSNYFQVSESQCAPGDYAIKTHQELAGDSVSIFGNHAQPAPDICKVKINNNGTMTINFIFDSPDQPLTTFIIQFFTNKTNSVPHGEQHISNFNDPACIFKTDIHGLAKRAITFIPVAFASINDLFSAHVTVAATGQNTATPSNTKGDTSEFGIKIQKNACSDIIETHQHAHNQKQGWLSFLGR